MDDRLKNHRHERLKRKASTDAQMVALAKEEVQLKKKFFQEMAHVDEDHKKTVKTLTDNMAKMTDTLTSGFATIHQVLMSQAASVVSPSQG